MSDTGLRELERRFRGSGSVEDETAWLVARLRAGDLQRDRLDFACWVGAPAAAAARRAAGGEPTDRLRHLLRRPRSRRAARSLAAVGSLGRWPREPLVRLALVAGRQRIGGRSPEAWDDRFGRVGRAFAVVEAWAVDPTRVAREELEAAEDAADRAAWGDHPETGEPVDDPAETPVARVAEFACMCATAPEARVPHLLHTALVVAEVWEAWDAFCQAAARELVPWALGYADPLRERIEARQQGQEQAGG